MMDEKTTKAVTRLLEQTQEGLLKWEVSTGAPPADLTQGGEAVVKAIYVAQKAPRLLRLYTYKDRYYVDEDQWHWIDGVALEVSDPQNRSWWRFPSGPVIADLLEAVTFKTARVDAFINQLIEEQ